MNRRAFIAGASLGVLAAPGSSVAQRVARTSRIGYLSLNHPWVARELLEVFRLALRDYGWNEGRNMVFEYRWAYGDPDRLPELASDLVRAAVDVIVTPTELTILAAMKATTTIPIVMVAAGDPVGSGLIVSLAQPGGNVTGLSSFAPELGGKRLELLREAIPRLSRVAILWNGDNPAKARELSQTQTAARSLSVVLQSLPVRGVAPDFPKAFAAMKAERAEAAIVLGDAMTFRLRSEIAAMASANRVPTMWESRTFMDVGGLISYGPDLRDRFRRAARYVDRILRGSKPLDLPVEQPTTFELVINLKTATALRLTIPQTLLLQADQVVDP